ncbi:MAG: hypothetical protein ACYSU0_21460, partial [Planctomycetota bacterium]
MTRATVRLAVRSVALAALVVAFARPAAAGPGPDEGSDRIHAVTIHDLPDPASPFYPPFQAWFDHHPRARPKRHSQLTIQTLERGSLMMAIAGGTAPDILRVYHHEAKAWIRNGFFEKLDRHIYKD